MKTGLLKINYYICLAMIFFCMNIVPNISYAQESFERIAIDNDFAAFFATSCDLDSDGDPDVLSGRLKLAWWENNGYGNFTKHIIDNYFTRLFSIFPTDFDKDGDIDLITCDIEEETIRWYKNNDKIFQKIHIIENIHRAESVAAADFDKDGDMDVVAITLETEMLVWWENDGNMNFDVKHELSTKLRGHKVAVADINNDGLMDIISVATWSSTHGTAGLYWWKNLGDKSFSRRVVNYYPGLGLDIVDIDNNGTLDIIYCLHDEGKVILYLNNGTGSFSGKILATNQSWPSWVAAGYINDDQLMDFVFVAGGRRDGEPGELFWFENMNNNNFDQHPINDSRDDVIFMADVADFNDDGKNDVVAGFEKERKLYWWKNIGIENINIPNQPNGPQSGVVGQVLNFSTAGSLSNFGHNIEYQFDWGDGQQSAWDGDVATHSYGSQGVFNIKAHARCQEHNNIVSDWSDNLQVTIYLSEYNVSGCAFYYSNDNPIENVSLVVSGDMTSALNTNAMGMYDITVETGGTIFLKPNKTKGEGVGFFDITTYDAALTAQHSVNLHQLNNYQQYAADADKNTQIQTYDAALIAQHSVGLNPLPTSNVSEWLFQPGSKYLYNVDSDRANEDFIGIIIGNVHGGWSQSEINKRKTVANNRIPKPLKIIETEKDLTVSFYTKCNQGIISMDVDIIFNEIEVAFETLEKTPVSENFTVIKNIEAGRIRVGMYSALPTKQPGNLLRFVFRKNKNITKKNSVQVKKLIMNNDVYIDAMKFYEEKNENNEIRNLELYQNYPNPFNSSTTIRYDVLKEGFGEVKIYNIFGQEIRALLKDNFSPGYHETTWDGKDDEGRKVTSGIYFYQLKIENFKSIKKLLMIE